MPQQFFFFWIYRYFLWTECKFWQFSEKKILSSLPCFYLESLIKWLFRWGKWVWIFRNIWGRENDNLEKCLSNYCINIPSLSFSKLKTCLQVKIWISSVVRWCCKTNNCHVAGCKIENRTFILSRIQTLKPNQVNL